MESKLTIAIVITVLDEAGTIEPLLEALVSQTLQPREIIIVDGGSKDGTFTKIEGFSSKYNTVRLIYAPGSNIPEGRDIGITASDCSIIAITDGGCVPANDWLRVLVKPFQSDVDLGLVSGAVELDSANHLESCIGRCSLAYQKRFGDRVFLPTARSLAFRRSIWKQVGGFPHQYATGEDASFILEASRLTGVELVNDAVVYWRPRSSYSEVIVQFYSYALGLAQAGLSGQFHFRTIALSLVGLAGLALALTLNNWLPILVIALVFLLYLARKARQGCFDDPSWRTYYRVPLILLAIHIGTMAGIIHGNWQRLSGGFPGQ